MSSLHFDECSYEIQNFHVTEKSSEYLHLDTSKIEDDKSIQELIFKPAEKFNINFTDIEADELLNTDKVLDSIKIIKENT